MLAWLRITCRVAWALCILLSGLQAIIGPERADACLHAALWILVWAYAEQAWGSTREKAQ